MAQIDATPELLMFRRLAGDYEFGRWLANEEKREIAALVEQVDPVRIYQQQGRVKLIQTLVKNMALAVERTK